MKLEDIPAFCIHLKKRTDREKNMLRELNYFTPNWKVFPAIKKAPGHLGTSASFQEVIKLAKKKRLPQVLIFEDDIKFTSKQSREKFQQALDTLPEDWDLMLGGVYSLINNNDLDNSVGEHLLKIGDFASLHCILIRDTAYDYVLRHSEKSRQSHLDRYLGNLSRKGDLNTYLVYPMMAIQYNTFSDNIKREVNYDRMLKKFEILTDNDKG